MCSTSAKVGNLDAQARQAEVWQQLGRARIAQPQRRDFVDAVQVGEQPVMTQSPLADVDVRHGLL